MKEGIRLQWETADDLRGCSTEIRNIWNRLSKVSIFYNKTEPNRTPFSFLSHPLPLFSHPSLPSFREASVSVHSALYENLDSAFSNAKLFLFLLSNFTVLKYAIPPPTQAVCFHFSILPHYIWSLAGNLFRNLLLTLSLEISDKLFKEKHNLVWFHC
jgi:hypothetical protein